MPEAQKTTPAAVSDDRDVWYLSPNEEVEIASEWLKVNDAKAIGDDEHEPRLTTEIHTARLTQDTTLYVLVRKVKSKARGARLTPMEGTETVNGERLTVPTPPASVIGEVAKCGPYRIRDFWDAGENRWSGRVDRLKLLSTISADVTPWRPWFLDAVRKEDEPSRLIIRSF